MTIDPRFAEGQKKRLAREAQRRAERDEPCDFIAPALGEVKRCTFLKRFDVVEQPDGRVVEFSF